MKSILSASLFALLLASCATPFEDQIVHGLVEAVATYPDGTIVSAGYDQEGNGCYWIGTEKTILAGPGGGRTQINGMVVSNGVIYTAGRNSNADACYWEGTIEHRLSHGGWVYSIFVADGTVYCAGDSGDLDNGGCYWIDGTEHHLDFFLDPSSIFVESGNLYVLGVDSDLNSCYWKNGKENVIASDTVTGLFSIFVDQGVVYLSGHDRNNHASYWEGTSKTRLSTKRFSDAVAIAVSSGQVYTAGEGGLWQGQSFSLLGKTTTSIAIRGSDVVVGGEDASGRPCFWMNSIETVLN